MSSIYFVSFGDGIKIGYSTEIEQHLKALQWQRPTSQLTVLCITHGDRRAESELHAKFSEHNVAGEWFRDCKEIREAAEKIGAGGLEAVGILPFSPISRSYGPHVAAAIELADFISRFAPDDFEPEDDLRSILWTLRYRPPKDLTVSQFHAVLNAAEDIGRRVQSLLDDANKKINDLRTPFRRAGRLVLEIRAADALAGPQDK